MAFVFTGNVPIEDKESLELAVAKLEHLFLEDDVFKESLYRDEELTFPFVYLNEGSFGITFAYQNYVLKYIKEFYKDEEELVNEIQTYQKLANMTAVPELYGFSDDAILMERIYGSNIYDVVSEKTKTEVLKKVDAVISEIGSFGYIPHDVEYVLDAEGTLRVYDFSLVKVSESENIERELEEMSEDVWVRLNQNL